MNHLILPNSVGDFMLVEIMLEHFIMSSTGECSLSCNLPIVPVKDFSRKFDDFRVLHLQDVEGNRVRWETLGSS